MDNWITLTEFAAKMDRAISTMSNWFSTHPEIKIRYTKKAGKELYINPEVVPLYIATLGLNNQTLSNVETIMAAKENVAGVALESFKDDELINGDPMAMSLKAILDNRVQTLKLQNSVSSLESRVLTIETDKQLARQELLDLPAPTVKATPLTTRQKIAMRINDYVRAANVEYQEARSKLNREMSVRYGRNFRILANKRGMGVIDVVEQEGLIEEMYTIACDIFKI